jgi:Ca2+-binding RTX toxin-like protein
MPNSLSSGSTERIATALFDRHRLARPAAQWGWGFTLLIWSCTMATDTASTVLSQHESTTIPSLIVASFFNAATPGFAKLADLSAFATSQYAYYSSIGVGQPLLGPYEAMGRGFAETAGFKSSYGALTTDFIAKAYNEVFGRAPTAEQAAHFQAQLSYFSGLYANVGLGSGEADLLAKGAVMGQMLGHASISGSSVFNYHAAAEQYVEKMGQPGFVPGLPLADYSKPSSPVPNGGAGPTNPAPTGLTFTAGTVVDNEAIIVEGRAGSALGSVTASDPGDTLTFTVDDPRFEIVAGSLKLKAGESIRLDDQEQISVVLKVVDSAGGSQTLPVDFKVRAVEALTAVDGYIKQANVFRDANGNGLQDPGEIAGVTDNYGNFQLLSGPGKIILTGGIDISTGAAFTGKLVAPEGSSVVTPLTDLVATLQAAGLSLQAAKAKVNDALGLTAGYDIQALDPIYFTLSSDPVERTTGKEALAAAVSLQNTIVQAAAVFQGAGASVSSVQAAQDIVAATIAAKITALAPGARIDLSDTTVLAAIVDGATTSSGNSINHAVSTAAQNVIAASNIAAKTALDDALLPGALTYTLLEDLSKIAIVAQGAAAGAIAAAADSGDASATTAFSGVNFDARVNEVTTAPPAADIAGLNGDDTFNGGPGNDIIYGYGGNDTLNGNDGDDRIFGGSGNDTLSGGQGNDIFNGSRGDDVINGGSGADTVIYDRDVEYNGILGAIINLDNGNKSDSLGVVTDGFGNQDTLIGIEEARGTLANDSFTGDDQDNFFRSLAGSDTMYGYIGFDTMRPGAGNDSFDGGNGSVDGSPAIDSLDYADAPSGLTATLGPGGAGSLIDPWLGTDTYIGVEGLNGTAFADQLTGNEQNNRFRGQAGADIIDGAAGIDTIDYRREVNFGGVSGVTVNLGQQSATDGFGNVDVLLNIENARGTPFADTLLGSAGVNDLRGDAGGDLIDGLGSPDVVFSEVLWGQAGNDVFAYRPGYGLTVVADLNHALGETDTIDLRAFGFTSFSQVAAKMVTAGPNVGIEFGNGDILSLWGRTVASLTASEFLL